MLLAIDVGNTRTKVYNLTRGGELSFETPTIIDKENAKKVINPGLQKDVAMIGASVVPKVGRFIDEASEEVLGKKPVWINASMDLGLKIAYKTPETLGADRLANVLGAFEVCDPPFIIVDLGTATKFEAVDHEGTYLGGSIMPSAQMGLRSLRFETAQLPTIQPERPKTWIGTDTKSAILTGAMFGHEYAVHGLLNHYHGYLSAAIYELEADGMQDVDGWSARLEKRGKHKVTAILTGGNEHVLRPLHSSNFGGLIFIREPSLTAKGLEVAAKRLGLIS